MSFSINVDWSNYMDDGWENEGRRVLEGSCTHHDKDKNNTNVEYCDYCEKCEINEDDCQPMMNYAYPLETTPSDEDILKVVKNTCLTVMEKDGEYFLVLCGGGMDLSQQIALSYVLIENWIPEELISQVSKQKGLSVGGEDWKLLRSKIIEQLKTHADRHNERLKVWKETEE